MNRVQHAIHQKFLTRAMNAEQRAAHSMENGEKMMWEEIAQRWRELARQTAPHPGA